MSTPEHLTTDERAYLHADSMRPTAKLRWNTRDDRDGWINEGVKRRITRLQQWHDCDHCRFDGDNEGGHWVDVDEVST